MLRCLDIGRVVRFAPHQDRAPSRERDQPPAGSWHSRHGCGCRRRDLQLDQQDSPTSAGLLGLASGPRCASSFAAETLGLRCVTGAPALRFAILTVLLQWCVDSLPPDAQVLEIGAGIGTTAIGLALATAHNQNALRSIVASDSEDEVLSLLRQNAEANGVADLPIVKWDASRGAASLDSLPVPARQLTHVIGSDPLTLLRFFFT